MYLTHILQQKTLLYYRLLVLTLLPFRSSQSFVQLLRFTRDRRVNNCMQVQRHDDWRITRKLISNTRNIKYYKTALFLKRWKGREIHIKKVNELLWIGQNGTKSGRQLIAIHVNLVTFLNITWNTKAGKRMIRLQMLGWGVKVKEWGEIRNHALVRAWSDAQIVKRRAN